MKPIIFVWGTRPESVKVAPVVEGLRGLGIQPILYCTGQHTTLLKGSPAEDTLQDSKLLHLPGQPDVKEWVKQAVPVLKNALRNHPPSIVCVQGDTASAYAASLAVNSLQRHQRYPLPHQLAHIEAGVRSGDEGDPWPEEMFRRAIDRLADYHFCPTTQCLDNLLTEAGVRPPMAGVAQPDHIQGQGVVPVVPVQGIPGAVQTELADPRALHLPTPDVDVQVGAGVGLPPLLYRHGSVGVEPLIAPKTLIPRPTRPTVPPGGVAWAEATRATMLEVGLYSTLKRHEDKITPPFHGNKAAWVTGNSGVSALYRYARPKFFPSGDKTILVTLHRRELLRDPHLLDIVGAIVTHTHGLPEGWTVVWPLHPSLRQELGIDRVNLLSVPNRLSIVEPLAYREMIHTLMRCSGVLTDSGGLTEDAVTLGIPTCILRNHHDRPEACPTGSALLVGRSVGGVEGAFRSLLGHWERIPNPVFGTQDSAQQIATILAELAP